MGKNATSRKYRKLERHKKSGKGRLKPGPKANKKSWQTRNAKREPLQALYEQHVTEAVLQVEEDSAATDSGPDKIDCDVCGKPVPTDAIYIIPDERTVCKGCSDTYLDSMEPGPVELA